MLPRSVYKYTHSVSVLQSRLINYCSGINLICRKRLNLDRILARMSFISFGIPAPPLQWCVRLCVCRCALMYMFPRISKEVKAVKLQQGCFRQNWAPKGSRAITHNSPALIGCIQPLYWKLSSFCRPQVPITSHLPFSSCCFATHTRPHANTQTRRLLLLHLNVNV